MNHSILDIRVSAITRIAPADCKRRGVYTVQRSTHPRVLLQLLVLMMLLLPGLAAAVICKSLEPDGSVSYTDVPAGECQQRVILPDYSRYAPRPIETAPAGASDAQCTAVKFERYRSIQITTPKNGDVERSNEGHVTVVVALDPGLQAGHLVRLSLDGRAVPGDFDSTAIDLSGVERGTHTLRATVMDATGRALIASLPVSFTMRKAGLFESESENRPDPEPATPDEGYPADDKAPDYKPPKAGGYAPPPDKPDYSPPDKPDFKNNTSPSYAPNKSYTPNYKP